jgi:hypothetical protein
LVEVEVVYEIPPPKFNPSLIDPKAPLLVQEGDIFSEPFSLFNNPYTMSGTSIFYFVAKSIKPILKWDWGNPSDVHITFC